MPAWFSAGSVLGELGLADDSAGRRRYAERMRSRAVEELADLQESPMQKELRRGWCLGGAAFRARMLRLLDATSDKLRLNREADGVVRRDHGEEEAARLLRLGLDALGFIPDGLGSLNEGDERKMALAALIREGTIVPNLWIARK
ncbi:hypothetical protein ACXR0O_15135 [Verrucomicrobiota bacterium sgz303538]